MSHWESTEFTLAPLSTGGCLSLSLLSIPSADGVADVGVNPGSGVGVTGVAEGPSADGVADVGVNLGSGVGVTGMAEGPSADGVADVRVNLGSGVGVTGVAEGPQATPKIAASRTIGPTTKYNFVLTLFIDITSL